MGKGGREKSGKWRGKGIEGNGGKGERKRERKGGKRRGKGGRKGEKGGKKGGEKQRSSALCCAARTARQPSDCIGTAGRSRSEPFGTVRRGSGSVRVGLGCEAPLRGRGFCVPALRCGAERRRNPQAPSGASAPSPTRTAPNRRCPVPPRRAEPGTAAGFGSDRSRFAAGRPLEVRGRACSAGLCGAGGAALFGTGTARLGTGLHGPARLGFVRFGSVRHGDNAAGNGRHGSATLGLDRLSTARHGSVRTARPHSARSNSARLGYVRFSTGTARLGTGQRGSAPLGLDRLSLVQLSLARFGTGTTRLGTGLHGQPARLRSARFGSLRYGDNAAGKGSTTPHRSAWIASTTARLGAGRPGPATLGPAR